MLQHRPHTTVVLAMSVDGKIADFRRSPARFGSRVDKAHLEKQIATSDAVLFGAGTLRAYGTTLTIVHIVTTHSANLNPEINFFKQPVRRWLLTTASGELLWKGHLQKFTSTLRTRAKECSPEFEQILVFETPTREIDIPAALKHLATLHITRLVVLGGGELVASMLELDLIDELWLTVCPLILGGNTAPTPVEGKGFLPYLAPKLQLLEVHTVEQEVFLHYRLQRSAD
jgi:5-amino-6-(5-phosphoribosylamino)uracil reductase